MMKIYLGSKGKFVAEDVDKHRSSNGRDSQMLPISMLDHWEEIPHHFSVVCVLHN